jgi:tripartite-type tricarboxylate transporter receptor subunit TctC
MFLPKGTPAEIVQKLNAAVIATLDTPSLRERMKQVGAELAAPDQRSSEYLGKLVESEIVKWAGPIKASGVTAE